MNPLLEVENLRVSFSRGGQDLIAVHDVSLSLNKGETLGLVGESGCGKSVTALSIMRLIARPGEIKSGQIKWQGKDLLDLAENEIQKIRGKQVSMIFQEPMTSLNPLMKCGRQVAEALEIHEPLLSREQVYARTLELLNLVGISDPERRFEEYPHHFSGGMRQRIMIAMSLICKPQLLIADEPTTALDVTIQAQILDLLQTMKKNFGLAMLLISHDLGIIAENCDRVAIMYAGRIVEAGKTSEVFSQPKHWYTKGLLAAVPEIGLRPGVRRLHTISGVVPALGDSSPGCSFAPRCERAENLCRLTLPPNTGTFSEALWACHFPNQAPTDFLTEQL